MSDDKLHDQIVAGDKAAVLLGSAEFTGAVDVIKAAFYDTWRACKDRDERDRIWVSLGLLDQLLGVLQNTVNNGKLAKFELDRLIKGHE